MNIASDEQTFEITSDGDCIAHLNKLKTDLDLNDNEKQLIEKSIALFYYEDDAEVDYDMNTVFEFINLMEAYPSHEKIIDACSEYISWVLEPELSDDLDPEVGDKLISIISKFEQNEN